MYKQLLKPLLFSFSPETAHHIALTGLKIMDFVPGLVSFVFKKKYRGTGFEKKGLHFSGRVGMAAGFDKDAKYFPQLYKLGFDFIEVGTVTPKPQEGNPKPRLFRLENDAALINRMGFNNEGLSAMEERLKKWRKDCPGLILGGNIGKNKFTPNDKAADDYLECFEALFPYVDYFVVNVSSPNTPGLRELQEKEPLTKLLNRIQELNTSKGYKPVLLKIAPDLTAEQIEDICAIVKKTGIDGVIATNTTVDRNDLKDAGKAEHIGAGGLSGKPLKDKSNQILKTIRQSLGKDYLIIGAGGIMSAEDALEKIHSGADLIQLYTGFVYEGPGLIGRVQEKIHSSFLEKA